MVRVLIVDDMPQVRSELRVLLPLVGDIRVVGEAGDGADAVRRVAEVQPDVVVMDLEMPSLDGYAATREIKTRWPSCRVIALTVHGDNAERQKATQAGVDAFIVKGTPINLLTRAVLGAPVHPQERSQ